MAKPETKTRAKQLEALLKKGEHEKVGISGLSTVVGCTPAYARRVAADLGIRVGQGRRMADEKRLEKTIPQAKKLKKQGLSLGEIAEKLGRSRRTIFRWLAK